jgi:zinc transporter, ZIP family
MLEGKFIDALLLTLFAGLATGVGGAIILFFKRFSSKMLSASLGFSAGVMILISFVELFREARASLGNAYGDHTGLIYTLLAFFGGMALIAIIDNVIPENNNPHEVSPMTKLVHEEAVSEENTKLQKEKNPTPKTAKGKSIQNLDNASGSKHLLRLGFFSALVIAIHNFPEGMATFMSAMTDTTLGISIAFAIAIHNIPEGIAIAVPIYYATHKRGKAVFNATLSGLAEPVGGVVGFLLLRNFLSPVVLGIVLAIVAGIMVYISLDELLPNAENYGEHHIAIMGVIAGMAFMGFGLTLF